MKEGLTTSNRHVIEPDDLWAGWPEEPFKGQSIVRRDAAMGLVYVNRPRTGRSGDPTRRAKNSGREGSW